MSFATKGSKLLPKDVQKLKIDLEISERAKPGLVKVKVCGGEIWSGLGSRLGQKEVGRLGYDLENGKNL